jgi:hypothetical protein
MMSVSGLSVFADQKVADDQWTWIQQTLANSTADYLWVTGHYPVWSVCEHGPTQQLVDQLKPMLEQYKVTGYASGHDHCLEYLDEGLGVVYVLSGAAYSTFDLMTDMVQARETTAATPLPMLTLCPRARSSTSLPRQARHHHSLVALRPSVCTTPT